MSTTTTSRGYIHPYVDAGTADWLRAEAAKLNLPVGRLVDQLVREHRERFSVDAKIRAIQASAPRGPTMEEAAKDPEGAARIWAERDRLAELVRELRANG